MTKAKNANLNEGSQGNKEDSTKAKNANLNEGSQGNKEDSRTKKVNSQATIKNAGSQAKKKELKSQAMLKNADSQAKKKELKSQAMLKNAGSQAEKEESESQAIGKEVGLQSKCVDKQNSKYSTPQVAPKGTPLIGKQVLDSLSKDCFWMHTCVCNLPNETPIQVDLEQSQFHNIADPLTWVYKWEVREFLSREMVNVSIIQVFMR